MQLPRMSTRRWILVVGLAALVIWGGMMGWRRHRFLALARARRHSNADLTSSMRFELQNWNQRKKELHDLERRLAEHQRAEPSRKAPAGAAYSGERNLWEMERAFLQEALQNTREVGEFHHESYERFSSLKHANEKSMRADQWAADHPWAITSVPSPR